MFSPLDPADCAEGPSLDFHNFIPEVTAMISRTCWTHLGSHGRAFFFLHVLLPFFWQFVAHLFVVIRQELLSAAILAQESYIGPSEHCGSLRPRVSQVSYFDLLIRVSATSFSYFFASLSL